MGNTEDYTKEITWLLWDKYNGVESPEFKKDVERLKKGEPSAYVIGWMPFLDCHIDLSSRPLIPRPETEYWTELVIKYIEEHQRSESLKILDLCAGSGCVGIALLHHLKNVSVNFGEVDAKHVSQIQKNLDLNNIDSSRASVIQSDLFENITDTYDYILTNPPYIAPEAKDIQQSVLDHEPHRALFAEENGFALIKQILRDAPQHLSPGGVLYIEHDPSHVSMIEDCLKDIQYKTRSHLDDQHGKARITRITFSSSVAQ